MKWTYLKQDWKQWPDWIVGSNFAQTGDHSVIKLHRLESCFLIYPGDTVERLRSGELAITPGGAT